MKKVVFLCAFLFMSIQTQAQMYIVQTEANYDNGDGGNPIDVIIIHSPDSSSPIVQPLGYNYNSNDVTIAQAWTDLNIVLNNIISEGYQMLPFSPNETGAWDNLKLFLAVP